MVSTRSAGMTSPSWSEPAGFAGATNEMNFWPNSVVGMICTPTFSGISSAASGSSATLMTACSPSWLDRADLADQDAVDPDVAERASWSPARSAWIVTVVTRSNFFW